MTVTPYERGQIAAQMVGLLEEIATDTSVPRDYREEALRLIELADEAWVRR